VVAIKKLQHQNFAKCFPGLTFKYDNTIITRRLRYGHLSRKSTIALKITNQATYFNPPRFTIRKYFFDPESDNLKVKQCLIFLKLIYEK